jgi:large subunit ribosomal protein L30
MLRIKLVKSPIGNNWRNRRTVAALGLRKVHQVVDQPDNSSIRGMIHHVQHLVTFEVVEGDPAGKTPKPAKAKAAPKPKPEPKSKPAAAKPAAKAPAKEKPAAKPEKKAAAKAKAPAKAKKETK